MSFHEGPLGQLPPTDERHRIKYPLTAETLPVEPAPPVIGIDWHRNFDRPVAKKNGIITEYFVGLDDLGSVRGGHCVCLKPQPLRDLLTWWDFYNQGIEGACFPAGTLIQRDDGSLVAIEDLRLLDGVRTAEGNIGVVRQTMVRWHDDGLGSV